MKYILAACVLIVLGVTAFNHFQKEEVYEATNTEVLTKVETIIEDALQNKVTEAQNASSTEIETKAKQAYEDEKTRMLTEIELEVTRQYRKEVEAREAELEESVSFVSARVN